MWSTPLFDPPGQIMFSKAQSGASSIEDTLWVCSQSTTWLTRNFSNGRLQGFPAEADAIQADPPIESSSCKALIHCCLEGHRAIRRQGHLRKVKAHCTDKSLNIRGNNRADTLAEPGGRADQDHHLPANIFHLSQSPLSTTHCTRSRCIPVVLSRHHYCALQTSPRLDKTTWVRRPME